VRSAVNIALDAARDKPGPIYTLGPLVHNPHVVSMLESLGLYSAPEVPDSGTVVIRAHGVTPARQEELEERGLNIVDATCARVKSVHKIAGRRHDNGYLVAVLGDEGHAEVDGIVGYAGGDAVVIKGPEDAASLPDADMVCLVAQTTQERERFEATAAAVRERYKDLDHDNVAVADTICDATRNRQEEVKRLAGEVEAVVVVGGPDSANTKRLAEVAEEAGVPSFLVDTENDLDREALKKFKTVGLTAGASTPNWLIRRVHDELVRIGSEKGPLNYLVFAMRWLVLANLYVAAGAVALTYAAARMQGFMPYLGEVMISFGFVFGIHTMTLLADRRALALNVPMRAKSFSMYRAQWIAASLAAMAGAIALAFSIQTASGLFLLVVAVISLLYPVKLIRGERGMVPVRSLAEVPGSKDIFMALGWAALVVVVPLIDHPSRPESGLSTMAAVVMVTGLVFVRALLRDFRDIQADRLIGRETLPILLGVARTRRLLYATLIAVAAVMVGVTLLGGLPLPLGLALLAPLAFAAACVPLFTRETIVQGFRAEGIIDGAFFLAGLVTLLF
jgi:4-hydroxy-3-methylbut-2-enyl diphosphate reductase